ncbi:hypothetical protein [Neptuniibacter sp. QD37_11]|uniref:hypothetical protein n=1 Tax=Neptuniibacter sp. QD37_11 TaxID=3398209 RepID=UPI0039F450C6
MPTSYPVGTKTDSAIEFFSKVQAANSMLNVFGSVDSMRLVSAYDHAAACETEEELSGQDIYFQSPHDEEDFEESVDNLISEQSSEANFLTNMAVYIQDGITIMMRLGALPADPCEWDMPTLMTIGFNTRIDQEVDGKLYSFSSGRICWQSLDGSRLDLDQKTGLPKQ